MKKNLITCKNSYIGTLVENWLLREPENYTVDTLDMKIVLEEIMIIVNKM